MFRLKQSSERPEDFVREYRSAVALVMAVGPVVDSETPKAPKDWWRSHLEPDASDLMKLRSAVLKRNDDTLDPNWTPASPLETMRRLRPVRRSYTIMPGVPQTTLYLPKWQIARGPLKGQDAIAVLEAFLAKLEKLIPLAQEYAID